MASSAVDVAVADLWAAITALVLFSFLDPKSGADTATSAQASEFHEAVQQLLPLAATVALLAVVAFIYSRLHHPRAPAGAGNLRLSESEFVTFTLCASVAVLEFFLFAQPAVGVDDVRALGLAAARLLPATATVTFFLGMMLIIIVHIRASGEGGGGAVAGDAPVQAPVWLLTKIAFGAAAALVCQMVVALYANVAKY